MIILLFKLYFFLKKIDFLNHNIFKSQDKNINNLSFFIIHNGFCIASID